MLKNVTRDLHPTLRDATVAIARRATATARWDTHSGTNGSLGHEPPRSSSLEKAVLSLTLDGEVWTVRCAEGTALIKESKGMRLLAQLVAKPGHEQHVLSLVGADRYVVDAGDSGEALDKRAFAAYRGRIERLREEQAEAEQFNDRMRAARAGEEIELIAAEIARAVGLGGRVRRVGSAAERARVNVQRRLKDAVRRISSRLPGLGRHLEMSLRTGTYCIYNPR